MSLNFADDGLTILCGANNVGKTNVLRALELFFSADLQQYNHKRDIPNHIEEGSRGAGYRTPISVEFTDTETGNLYKVTQEFIPPHRSSEGSHTQKVERKNQGKGKWTKAEDVSPAEILAKFNFLFVESSNVDLPKLIASIFEDEVLPNLDKLRVRQREPLLALEAFIEKSQRAVERIEKDISTHFSSLTQSVEGIDASQWKAKVNFPAYLYLREAVSRMVSLTIHDTNDSKLDTKGSGIQRLMLLALIKYVQDNSKGDTKFIWAIDEPEVFLQPGLQKRVHEELASLSKDVQIIVTTHSPHFIDISDVKFTYLLETEVDTKEYKRRAGKVFQRISTVVNGDRGVGKLEAIRDHMGIGRNDAWNIVGGNLLVEGIDDKDYLIALFKLFKLDIPNILVAGGADKVKGYLQFLSEFCADLPFRPEVCVLLDHDAKGKSVMSSLNVKDYKAFSLAVKYIPRCDGRTGSKWEYAIEDFIYDSVMIDAANTILRKLQYKIITKNQRCNRFAPANESSGILQFITQEAKQRNPDKSPKSFGDTNLKLWLNKIAVDKLGNVPRDTLEELDSEQPTVRLFLSEILEIIN